MNFPPPGPSAHTCPMRPGGPGIVLLLIALLTSGCHLHVHMGGTYYRDKADKAAPPIELTFPKEEEPKKDAKEN